MQMTVYALKGRDQLLLQRLQSAFLPHTILPFFKIEFSEMNRMKIFIVLRMRMIEQKYTEIYIPDRMIGKGKANTIIIQMLCLYNIQIIIGFHFDFSFNFTGILIFCFEISFTLVPSLLLSGQIYFLFLMILREHV